jgi:hypothetical protein
MKSNHLEVEATRAVTKAITVIQNKRLRYGTNC